MATEGIKLADIGTGDLGWDLLPRDQRGPYSCPRCRSRPLYAPPEVPWIRRKLGKDIAFSCDCYYLVSQRFVEWIEREQVRGAILTQLGADTFFLDAVQVEVNEDRSVILSMGDVCPSCLLPQYRLFQAADGTVDGPRKPCHAYWPYGDQRVIARSRQLLAGGVFSHSPVFLTNNVTHALARRERFSARRFDEAIGLPCPPQEAPESVIHRRSVPVSPGKGRSAPPEAVLAPLLALLAHPAPAFVCRNADGRSPAAPIALRHTAQPPATPEDVEAARKLLGKRAALYLELFSRHDGVRLYEEPVHGEPGVALCSIREWPALTQQCREALPPDEPMDGLRAKDPFVAIGQAESAGAYLVVMTRGALAGQVRVVQPADWSVSVLATNLAELVDALCDPVPLIQNSLGQSLRYSDGIRRGEYFPVEYLPDAKAKPAS